MIEDDVIPSNNAAELLLRGFDEHTATVAGPYRSRFHDGYVAWRSGRDIIREHGEGVETIEGNGFGCTLFRTDLLREALFTCRQPPYVDFDPAFYERLKATNLKVKLCWEAECEHLENNTRPIMTWDHWPESWETTDLSDYRSGFLTGQEACQWIVDTLNGSEPTAIWGLSDGDVAWWCYDALAKLADVDRIGSTNLRQRAACIPKTVTNSGRCSMKPAATRQRGCVSIAGTLPSDSHARHSWRSALEWNTTSSGSPTD